MRKNSHFRDEEEEVRKKVLNNWNVGNLVMTLKTLWKFSTDVRHSVSSHAVKIAKFPSCICIDERLPDVPKAPRRKYPVYFSDPMHNLFLNTDGNSANVLNQAYIPQKGCDSKHDVYKFFHVAAINIIAALWQKETTQPNMHLPPHAHTHTLIHTCTRIRAHTHPSACVCAVTRCTWTAPKRVPLQLPPLYYWSIWRLLSLGWHGLGDVTA